MAAPTLPPDVETPSEQSLGQLLNEQQERFAAYVASGKSYRQSALAAGYCESWGWQLMQMPAIKARVNEIIQSNRGEDLGSIASRAWIETQIIGMVQKLEQPAKDLNLDAVRVQLQALMSLAKLKGLIVERKQIANAHVDFGKMPAGAARGMLEQYLGQLNPAARAELTAASQAVDATVESDT